MREKETVTVLNKIDNSELCTGCRLCEVACSFHHCRTFDPEASSIKIYRDDNKGTISITILSTCDQCHNEAEPLCVTFCDRDALGIKALTGTG